MLIRIRQYNPRKIRLRGDSLTRRLTEDLLESLWPTYLEPLFDVSVSPEEGLHLKEIFAVEMLGYFAFWLLTAGKPYRPIINPLTPNDDYSGRTTPLTSKRCILYIYSTNTGTEYFKHGIYSPFLSLQNAVCFIILTYLIPVLFTFFIHSVLKLKKKNSGAI